MYQGKRKNKRWSIQQKNEIVLLYLDGHMARAEILKTFNSFSTKNGVHLTSEYQLSLSMAYEEKC